MATQGRASGDALNLEIAGVTVCFEGLGGPLGDAARERYGRYVSTARASLRVMVTLIEHVGAPMADDRVAASVVGDSQRPDVIILRRYDRPSVATLDTRGGEASLSISPDLESFDAFMTLLWSVLLADSGGLLLAAICVAFCGVGVVLVGEPGRGAKSLARQGFPEVLDASVVAITRNGDGGFTAWETPFAGAVGLEGLDTSVPLLALYLTRMGRQEAVHPLSPDGVLLKVFNYTIFYGPDEKRDVVADTARALATRKLVGELEWVASESIATFLEREVRNVVSTARTGGAWSETARQRVGAARTGPQS